MSTSITEDRLLEAQILEAFRKEKKSWTESEVKEYFGKKSGNKLDAMKRYKIGRGLRKLVGLGKLVMGDGGAYSLSNQTPKTPQKAKIKEEEKPNKKKKMVSRVCVVCGDTPRSNPAQKWHLSRPVCHVVTCAPCQKFFSHAQKRKTAGFTCKRSGDCQIDKKTRGDCSFCRLNKCYRVGMKKYRKRKTSAKNTTAKKKTAKKTTVESSNSESSSGESSSGESSGGVKPMDQLPGPSTSKHVELKKEASEGSIIDVSSGEVSEATKQKPSSPVSSPEAIVRKLARDQAPSLLSMVFNSSPTCISSGSSVLSLKGNTGSGQKRRSNSCVFVESD